MHSTAYHLGGLFLKNYMPATCEVLDVGSYDVNGSLRDFATEQMTYTGADMEAGPGVDVVLSDPYKLPFDDGSFDGVVTSSTFEHAEFFWLLFNECTRVLRPGGYLYLNAPSNGAFHQYPYDFWRFYPDAGLSLCNWAVRHGYEVDLIESATAPQGPSGWNDFFAVFQKGRTTAPPSRFLSDAVDGCSNIRRRGTPGIINFSAATADQMLIAEGRETINRLERELSKRTSDPIDARSLTRQLAAERARADELQSLVIEMQPLIDLQRRPFEQARRHLRWIFGRNAKKMARFASAEFARRMEKIERKNAPIGWKRTTA